MKYYVVKYHLAGILKGMTTQETTGVSFEVNKMYHSYGEKYVVVSCDAIEG